MRFLADHDVYATTVRFLIGLNHDVVTAAQLGLFQASDLQLLNAAQQDRRILITRDRDYGGLVFVQGLRAGVVYLRILPSTQNLVHAELETVLTTYSEPELATAFLVVEPGRHRIRRMSP